MCSFRVNFFLVLLRCRGRVGLSIWLYTWCPGVSFAPQTYLWLHFQTCVVLVTLLTEEQMCVCVALRIKKEKNINTSTQWQQSCDYKANAVPPVGLLESSVFFKLLRRIFTAPFPLVGSWAGMRVESYQDLLIWIFWSICRHAWYYCQAH